MWITVKEQSTLKPVRDKDSSVSDHRERSSRNYKTLLIKRIKFTCLYITNDVPLSASCDKGAVERIPKQRLSSWEKLRTGRRGNMRVLASFLGIQVSAKRGSVLRRYIREVKLPAPCWDNITTVTKSQSDKFTRTKRDPSLPLPFLIGSYRPSLE